MNYYNPYTGSRKKIMKKVITVLVAAAVLCAGTFVFGNYLKRRAESTSSGSSVGIGREDLDVTGADITIPPPDGGIGSSVSVKGFCVPLYSDFPAVSVPTDGTDDTGDTDNTGDTGDSGNDDSGKNTLADSSFDARLTAAAEGHSGVLIPLTGDDGMLLYNSRRAAEASRLPSNPALPDMEALSAAVSLAKSKGLRTTALVSAGAYLTADADILDSAIAADARVAADAAEAGFDEVIICSFITSPEDITGERSRTVLRYLNQLTAAVGTAGADNSNAADDSAVPDSATAVGLALPADVYMVANLSPQIELFASRSVFLAMELTEEQSTVDYIDYICKNLAGTLSVYNMRLLISPADTAVGKAVTDRLGAVAHENYLYTNIPEEADAPDPDVTGTDDLPEPEPTDEPWHAPEPEPEPEPQPEPTQGTPGEPEPTEPNVPEPEPTNPEPEPTEPVPEPTDPAPEPTDPEPEPEPVPEPEPTPTDPPAAEPSDDGGDEAAD